eukprot:CAMPEP_0201496786 /NCGR_PEP_ID=MMETSP0151_2-20130828/61659_1 /ASSEMBLY_ACC=CAM_ASM_000257 /TAXON_ID=200890 /ORGANISM="Paramoeba atlantica, Strain 621/1 / CCAP 1560/9" /LENGTH=137 /DNA_ID=CAMNT_0047886873 /DNA_START=129 /DNA_END=542 /DNA_ORIENTATION=-
MIRMQQQQQHFQNQDELFKSLRYSLFDEQARWMSTSAPKEEPKMMASFVCNVCQTRNSHSFAKSSYEKGVVLARCPGCQNLHLVADNLGWFSKQKKNLETMLKERGEDYLKFNDEGTFEAALNDKIVQESSNQKEEE